MQPRVEQIRACLQAFDFKKLFIQELGWDKHSTNLPVAVDGKTFHLHAIAEKRGMQVFELAAPSAGDFPDYDRRRKIERQVAKLAHEHIIIYTDANKTVQKWQWVRREPGRPLACREPSFEKGRTGEALVQKLQILAVALEEEEKLSLVEVTGKAKKAFDVDRVTKRFYDRFKTEHTKFLSFIKGITEKADQEWYASLMLNRLMFIYFIQKKGFLDGDLDYLRNRLQTIQERKGKDKFLGFYQYFLLRLFHEGLGKPKPERKKDLESLIGEVPYLNGGLFDVHQLEKANPDIQISDDAFKRLFDFFDAYQWHLDDRPLHADNEINPDVLGYIFEKYINQKQMGAYYTKEDITGYNARNTLIPFLFNAAEKTCAIAFKPDSAMWQLLREDPDRYIYAAMRRGVDRPLPPAIAEGAADVSKRKGWNAPAAEEFALPTETWREHVARRQRCLELRAKLSAGEVHDINDFITLNLDICQFAEDVIANCEGSDLLLAFWKAIQSVTVLDPTCGSGAFLFAALNILEPLYEACLERMRGFLEDLETSKRKHHPATHDEFRKVLQEANDTKRHPNHRYFVLKSIILKNLYGVDIMEEAVEICKLRLFLNLVAQVGTSKQVEPLPDIDFNIRPGNTLIGFATLDDVKRSLLKPVNKSEAYAAMPGMGESEEVDEIVRAAKYADDAFRMFHEIQTVMGMSGAGLTKPKQDLRQKLDSLNAKLDHYLAGEYGIEPKKPADFAKWKASHQPFHWFAEFYGIMSAGGFDVVIGNPPYVEYRKIINEYQVKNFSTMPCANLWAFVLEQCKRLANSNARLSLIVPLSLISAQKMNSALRLLDYSGAFTTLLALSADGHPSVLFDGVKMSFAILTHQTSQSDTHKVFVSKLYRWLTEERPTLFPCIQYAAIPMHRPFTLSPKVAGTIGARIFDKLLSQSEPIGDLIVKQGSHRILYHRVVRHFVKSMIKTPYFWNERDGEKKSEDYKELYFKDKDAGQVARAILVSSTYYSFFFLALSDSYHLGRDLILEFPGAFSSMSKEVAKTLAALGDAHEKDLFKNCLRRKIEYQATGWIEYDEFYPRLSKPIIDEIDTVLAKHYGFTDEELEFIINYDIKYRLGQEAVDDGDDE